MLAVVEINKKQYLVEKGLVLEAERLKAEVGDIIFDKVLLLEKSRKVNVGSPYLDGVKIKAKIIKEKKSDKVIVYKYNRRKKYRKKQGHRQIHTVIEITDILTPPKKSKE